MATEVIEATIDSWLESGAADNNYGSSTTLEISDVGVSGGRKRIILSFSLSTLPSGLSINSANLVFKYAGRSADPQGRRINLYKVTQTAWVEGEVTWNSYSSGNSWSTPGGDYVTSNPSGAEFTIPAPFNDWEVDVQTLLQDAIDNSLDLHLIMIIEDEGVSNGHGVVTYSKEVAVLDPPTLTVAYSRVYPTDAITRATSLKHIYNREAGIYDLEIGLGEVAADFSIPDVELVSKSSSPIEEEAKEVERIAEEAGVTPAIINKLNRMEEQAQIDFPIPTREIPQQAGTGIRTTPEHQRILTEQFEDPMRLIPKGGGGVQEIQDLVAELKGRATPTVSGQFHEAVSGEETSRIITNTPMGKEGLATERQRMRELQEQGLSREEISRIIAEQ